MNPPSSTMIRGGLGLTKRQADLLRFIESCGPVSPSFREMKEAMGVSSLCIVYADLNALENRRYIRRLPNRARAIEVLRPAEPMLRPPTPPRICWIPLRGIINLNEHRVRS